MINGSDILAASGIGLDFTPAFAWWVLVPVLLLATTLVCYFTIAQHPLASRMRIGVLLLIRLTLIALIAVLLTQPALRWTQTKTTAGTLWILLDQSPSMSATDPQATDIERLRWADALGHLPGNYRTVRPELDFSAALALRADLLALRPPRSAAPAAEESARVAAAADAIDAFAKRMDAFIAELTKRSPAPAAALSHLGYIQRELRAASPAARRATSLAQLGDSIRWAGMHNAMNLASGELYAWARSADGAFLSARRSDPVLTSALAKLANQRRSDLALAALTSIEPRPGDTAAPAELPRRFRTRIATFSDAAALGPSLELGPPREAFATALSSRGNATSIAAGLGLIAEQIGPEEPASVIIVSDGRHNLPGDPTEAARLLSARGVRIHALLVGSSEVSPDAAVDSIDAPDWIYKDDTLTASATIRIDGLARTAGAAPRPITVDFYRGETRLSSQTVLPRTNQDSQRLSFQDKPPTDASSTNVFEYEVRVAEVAGESNTQNNRQSFRVALKKDKLFALLVDETPRWEWRYLHNYIGRDPRLKLQSVLFDAAEVTGVRRPGSTRASPANPRVDAELLPQTKDQWQAFDLIILGDVSPQRLPPEAQHAIALAVRDRGATLVVVAGQAAMPEAFGHGSPLADILPVSLSSAGFTADDLARHARYGFRPVISPEGVSSVLSQFGLDGPASQGMGQTWFWHSAYTSAKPSATSILHIGETTPTAPLKLADARRRSLVSSMNVGLGKVLYVSSDQTWRWRNLAWENAHDRFWGQVLRWAVGSDLPAGGKFVRFGTNRPRYAQGDPVIVTARVFREDLTPYTGLTFAATARPAAKSAAPATAPVATTLNEARFIETPDAPGYYRATLAGLPSGDFDIALRGSEVERLLAEDPSVTQRQLTINILPQLNVEQRNTNTDRALLARITDSASGATLDGFAADVLAGRLPEIKHTYHIPQHVGLFTDPGNPYTWVTHWVFLALFALLLTLEWALRKRSGMI